MATSIPIHKVAECRHIGTRLDTLDRLIASGFFHGGYQAACARVEHLPNAPHLKNELKHYWAGTNCCTCFWRILYDSLPEMKKLETAGDNENVYIVEIACKRDEVEEDRCVQRLLKQKTHSITEYAYVLDEMETKDEHENDTIFRMTYKSQNGRIKKYVFERAFSDECSINNNLKTSPTSIVAIVKNPYATVVGDWI